MNRRKGFTLIELLVVIAIIAVLSAILFPVFARAKDAANRSSDMGNMNELRNALQLYRVDQGGYPPALLGYATGYMSVVPTAADIVPANQVAGPLFPRRIGSLNTFRPAILRPTGGALEREFVTAVWPTSLENNPAAGHEFQRFGPADGTVKRPFRDNAGVCSVIDSYFYRLSGYDVATVRTPTGTHNEIHYSLFWSGWTVPQNPCNPAANEQGSAADDPRQLGYFDPPDTTVVTWNSIYREYDQGLPTRTRRDIVLFLGGNARMIDSQYMANRAWKVLP
jgi:prepilin-type N-terminal cleavage/methylation domain-containing protein